MASTPPNKKQKSDGKRAPNFRIQVAGGPEIITSIRDRMELVREKLQRKLNKVVSNYDVMDSLLDAWLAEAQKDAIPTGNFTPVNKVTVASDTKDTYFVGTKSAVSKLIETIEHHQSVCTAPMDITKVTKNGHVGVFALKCKSKAKHGYLWSSSPTLPDNKFVVNYKMAHALTVSGILVIGYERLCRAAGIGTLNFRQRRKHLAAYNDCIDEEYDMSVTGARFHEMMLESDEMTAPITVMSDARHGTRKNSKDTSVVVIGDNCHKVLCHVGVSKSDEPSTQKHELAGTKTAMDELHNNGVNVKMWVHDRNTSVNKEVESQGMKNENDLWHGLKGVKKAIKNVAGGAKMRHGKTWHHQLDDKVISITNHFHYACKDSQGDKEKLKKKLDNIIFHYKGDHTNCSQQSKCKKEENYEPKKKLITNIVAESLLTKAIRSTMIYKNVSAFCNGKDTHYVESFNNVINIFQDKRVSFSSVEYNKRAKLAVLHWNENVDRAYSSIWSKPLVVGARRPKCKKVYKEVTYNYTNFLWNRQLQKLIQK